MVAWLKRRWASFVRFWKNTEIIHHLSQPEAEFQKYVGTRFNEAKTLSDFVGMITRLAFVQFVWRYFAIQSPDVEGWYRAIYGLCAISAFGISIVLAQRIGVIIFLFEANVARNVNNAVFKAIMYIVALLMTCMLYLGIYDLVSDLAVASTLLGQGK